MRSRENSTPPHPSILCIPSREKAELHLQASVNAHKPIQPLASSDYFGITSLFHTLIFPPQIPRLKSIVPETVNLPGIKAFVKICRNPYASIRQPSKGYKAFLDLLIVGSPSFFASYDEGFGAVIWLALA
ncbi:MAG: hypothetical protein ACI8Q1_003306, partial [Parvicella sp.]